LTVPSCRDAKYVFTTTPGPREPEVDLGLDLRRGVDLDPRVNVALDLDPSPGLDPNLDPNPNQGPGPDQDLERNPGPNRRSVAGVLSPDQSPRTERKLKQRLMEMETRMETPRMTWMKSPMKRCKDLKANLKGNAESPRCV